MMKFLRPTVIALAAAGAFAVSFATPAEAWWRGGGVVFGVSPGPFIFGPPVVYAPPPYYPPPVAYAPAPYGRACYAGPYVCPLEVATPVGGPCGCPANGGSRVGGRSG